MELDNLLVFVKNSKDEKSVLKEIKLYELKNYNTFDDCEILIEIIIFLGKKRYFKSYYKILKYGPPKFLVTFCNSSDNTPSRLNYFKKLSENEICKKIYKKIYKNITPQKLNQIISTTYFTEDEFKFEIETDLNEEYYRIEQVNKTEEIRRMQNEILLHDIELDPEYIEKYENGPDVGDEKLRSKINKKNNKLYDKIKNKHLNILNNLTFEELKSLYKSKFSL